VEPPLMSFRATAIVLAVLIVLAGVVWFSEFRDKGAQATGTTDTQKLTIFKFDDQDTRSIVVAKADQKLEADKDEQGNWTLQPGGLPGDRVRISSVLARLDSLQATRRVTDEPTDLAQYGLDNPPLIATATQADGTAYTLLTGAKSPNESSTYVKKEQEPTVFLIPNQLVSDLDRLVTDPPIQQPTPTPAPIPPPIPSPSPEPTATPSG
jgi:hypothetical protein